MRHGNAALAARERDFGLRRIGRITRWAAVAGAACSAIVGIALAHNADATVSQSHHGGSGTVSQSHHGGSGSGGIVAPAQPPQQSAGSGQVTSGGTSHGAP